MKSRFLSLAVLSVLVLFLPLTSLMAAPPEKPPSLETRVAVLEALVATLQSDLATTQTDLATTQTDLATTQTDLATTQSDLAANTAADTTAHHTKYTNAQAIAAVGPHYTDAQAIAAVGPHSPDFSTLLAGVTRFNNDPLTNNTETIRFSGMNVQIVNGEVGGTNTTNGTGNLILGYNESRFCPCDNVRTGSHMLVIGKENNYSSYGGMVVGFTNSATGAFSTVSGGSGNIASGVVSTVSGGANNEASGNQSSVSGGLENLASGQFSSISGGDTRTAADIFDWVAGGLFQDD